MLLFHSFFESSQPVFFNTFFLFMHICVCLYDLCVPYACQCLQWSEITGSLKRELQACEPSGVGAENPAWVLCS